MTLDPKDYEPDDSIDPDEIRPATNAVVGTTAQYAVEMLEQRRISSEVGINVSLKAQGGYNDPAPWVTIHAANPEQLEAQLDALISSSDIFAKVGQANRALRDAHAAWQPQVDKAPKQPAVSVTQPQVTYPPQNMMQQAPQAAVPPQQAPQGQPYPQPVQQAQNGVQHPQGATCTICGNVLTYRSGVSQSSGRAWKAWGCPAAPRGDRSHTMNFV